MPDTPAHQPARPAAAYTTRLRADHCPDCGGPVGDSDTGERGCLLCGAWVPTRPEPTEATA